jgi:hypothetical protein
VVRVGDRLQVVTATGTQMADDGDWIVSTPAPRANFGSTRRTNLTAPLTLTTGVPGCEVSVLTSAGNDGARLSAGSWCVLDRGKLPRRAQKF